MQFDETLTVEKWTTRAPRTGLTLAPLHPQRLKPGTRLRIAGASKPIKLVGVEPAKEDIPVAITKLKCGIDEVSYQRRAFDLRRAVTVHHEGLLEQAAASVGELDGSLGTVQSGLEESTLSVNALRAVAKTCESHSYASVDIKKRRAMAASRAAGIAAHAQAAARSSCPCIRTARCMIGGIPWSAPRMCAFGMTIVPGPGYPLCTRINSRVTRRLGQGGRGSRDNPDPHASMDNPLTVSLSDLSNTIPHTMSQSQPSTALHIQPVIVNIAAPPEILAAWDLNVFVNVWLQHPSSRTQVTAPGFNDSRLLSSQELTLSANGAVPNEGVAAASAPFRAANPPMPQILVVTTAGPDAALIGQAVAVSGGGGVQPERSEAGAQGGSVNSELSESPEA
ncbi:hypothetical protein FA95DRAFT_1612452 [Auriscalpium vulgare]|uniref:Uncharacterized protein n=1 Tax=Auriscalpium vulgare TaxID=40419 RepID=A0ACB8R663_9AGAM|nr:hypothetical protein FA95DRAFT_1612452 [Auriscalpium vulgare]